MRRLIRHIHEKAEEVGSSFKDLWTQIKIDSMKIPLPGHNTSPFGSKDDPPCPCCGFRMKPWLHLKKPDPQLPEHAGPIGRHTTIRDGRYPTVLSNARDGAGIIHPTNTLEALIEKKEGELRPIQIR